MEGLKLFPVEYLRMTLEIGVLLGIGTMLLWGVSDAIIRIPTKAVGAYQTLFYNRILQFAYFLLFALFVPVPQIEMWQVGALMAISVVFLIAKYAILRAINLGEVSIAFPIGNSWGALGTVLAIVLLNESIPQAAVPIIAAIFVGVVLVSISKLSGLKISKEAPFALVAMAGWAIAYTGIDYFAKGMGQIYPLLITEGFMLLWLMGMHAGTEHKLKLVPKYFGIMCLTAFLFALGFVLFATAPAYGVASVAIPLATASPAVVVVLARVLYKEELEPHQLIGVAIIILGIVGLALC